MERPHTYPLQTFFSLIVTRRDTVKKIEIERERERERGGRESASERERER